MRPRWIRASIVAMALSACAGAVWPAYAQTKTGGGAKSPALGSASASGTAPAPATGGAAADGLRDGKEVYKEALKFYEQGEFVKALMDFQELWKRDGKPKVMGNIGRCELKLKRYRDAAEHLDLFLRLEKGMTQAERDEIRGLLNEAKARTTTLRLTVQPEGAEVFVDGVSVGKAPFDYDLYVVSGHHKIEAKTPKGSAPTEIDTVDASEWPVKLEVVEVAAAKKIDPPPPPFPTRTVLLGVGIGLTAVTLAVGIGSVAGFVDNGNTAKQRGENPTMEHSKAEANFKSAAVWALLGAGVFGGGTLAIQLSGAFKPALQQEKAAPPVTARFRIGPQGGVVELQRQF